MVVIGNFDGVHRGHQALLHEATSHSRAAGLSPRVLTFSPHPAEALGRAAPPVLTPVDRKAELLREHFPEVEVVVQPFDDGFAAQSPEQFARFLREALGARQVMVGQNFRFGQGRAGDFARLRQLGAELGFDAQAIRLQGDGRGVWSSTRVRQALAAGDLADATALLGRPHELEGVVEHGQHRARTLGFPTANLGGVVQARPSNGVYAVRAWRVEPGALTPLGGGVANIGLRPTVAAGFAIEAHVFDFTGDLYGARVRLHLVARLRDERTFGGIDELRSQIGQDATAARVILAASPPQ
ncbi:MAG: riboflavin biosynthesis protein RibF [Myxococcales bacterium]|nr:MAG: riboflavin biosynthesis protein RibF [Myxococcales bacterium]